MSIPAADVLICGGLISAVFATHLALTIDDPPSVPDEGYLWYGTLEVSRRAVPVRDFRSYEPGRYWISLVFLAFGRGLPWIRLASSVTLGVGALATTLALRHVGHGWPVTAAAVLLIAAWSPQPHKRYEQAAFLLGTGAIAWLLTDPSAETLFVVGAMAGLAIVVGANLGLYVGFAAGLSLLVTIRSPEFELLGDGWWMLAGLAAGSSPLWIMGLTVRGFARALIGRRLVDPVRRRSTNLPLPIPVPWRPTPSHLSSGWGTAASLVTRALFVAIPAGALAVTLVALAGPARWAGDHPVVVAVGLVSLPAWHHVVSRADVAHLSHLAGVVFLGPLAISAGSGWTQSIGIGLTAVITFLVGGPLHARLQRRRVPEGFVRRAVLGHRAYWFGHREALLVDAVLEARDREPPCATLLAVPNNLWLFPLLGTRSAVFDTYCVYPASESAQHRMIAEIEQAKPSVAAVALNAVDNRDDLRFSKTHPLVWAHLCAVYEPAPVEAVLPADLVVLRRQ